MINQTPGLKLILACCFLAINSQKAIAQITPDNTLGAESSRVVPNGAIDEIDGGALRSRNLFHSFSQFNVNNGQSVYFSNPSGIENILTRVTGRNASNILGTLGVDGAANLFLINPNGIVFGENARLDVNGSFVGSTANGLRFGEQGNFSATNPESVPLLTVNPSALLFNNQFNDRGNITNLAQQNGLNGETNVTDGPVGLQVPDGKTLALVGGNVLLNDGNLTAFGGRIEIGSVTGTGKVNLDAIEDGFIFNYDAVDDLGEIRLENTAVVDVSAGGGGSINVTGKDIHILGGSSFRAGMRWQSGSIDSQAGDINLNAKDKLEIDNSFIINDLNEEALGNSGDINIISNGSLSLTNGAVIRSSIFGKGDSGNISITANDATFLDTSYIVNNVQSIDAVGNAGNIDITTGSLTATNGAQINSFTRGQGNAGNITIQARDAITFDGVDSNGFPSGSFGDVFADGVGNGGTINITASEISMNDSAQIQSSTFGKGNAGNIQIQTSDLITGQLILENDALIAAETFSPDGKGGNINIEVGKLIGNNGGQISTGSGRQFQEGDFGRAGDLIVTAFDSIELDGVGNANRTGFFSETSSPNRAGDLTVNTNKLTVQNGAGISSGASGSGSLGGDGGNLVINATESIDLIGTSPNFRSALVTEANGLGNAGDITIATNRLSVKDEASISAFVVSGENTTNQVTIGNGGNIDITVDSMEVANGGQIIAATFGQGSAGNITINAFDDISFDGSSDNFNSGAFSSVGESGIGNGGDININTREISVSNGAELVASVSNGGKGEAGNIQINADNRVTLNNQAKLVAESASGDGGNINLQLGELLSLRNGSQISTTAGNQQFGGNGGNINIDTPIIVAVPKENSDITANAFSGNGGNIDISTEGIFGIGFQEQPTPESGITASSEFGLSGNVEINTPDVDPSKGLIELPDNIIDNSDQVYIACIPGSPEFENTFISVGTGGIPVSPLELLQESSIITNWVSLPQSQTTENRRIKLPSRKVVATNQIVEATGWIVDQDGDIEFVAQRNHISSKNPRHSPRNCLVSK